MPFQHLPSPVGAARQAAVLLSAVALLSGCGKAVSGKASAPDMTPAPAATTPVPAPVKSEVAQSAKAAPWATPSVSWAALKAKIGSVSGSTLKDTLGKIDLASIKSQADALWAAVDRKNFIDAGAHAKKLDALLHNEWFSKTVEFLALEAEKGTDAARAALESYVNEPGASEDRKKFGELLAGHFNAPSREDVKGITSMIVFLYVRSQVGGSHEGEALAGLAAMAAGEGVDFGFRAHDKVKDGKELPDALAEASGTNKEEVLKNWNKLVDAAGDKASWQRTLEAAKKAADAATSSPKAAPATPAEN